MYDATRHKTFSSGLTPSNELHKHLIFILGNIIVFLYQELYDIMWIVAL